MAAPTISISPVAGGVDRNDTITVEITHPGGTAFELIRYRDDANSGLVEVVAFGTTPPATANAFRFGVVVTAITDGFRYEITNINSWQPDFTIYADASNAAGEYASDSVSYTVNDPVPASSVGNFVPIGSSNIAPEDTIDFDVVTTRGLSSFFIFAGYVDPGELVGVESLDLVALIGFGIVPMPSYTAEVVSVVGDTTTIRIGRIGGWARDVGIFVIGADNGIAAHNVGPTQISTIESYFVSPSTPRDEAVPDVAVVSPTPGTTLGRAVPLVFDVTDDTALFRRVIVTVAYPTVGRVEVAHDGDAFVGSFADSSRVAIAGGWRYTVIPTGGWTARPMLKVFAIDRVGNEAP